MARSIWKGSVSMGLVIAPVKLYTATGADDLTFHQFHDADNGRIGYQRVCKVCDQEVPYASIVKGVELPGDKVVTLTAADMESLPLPTARIIEVTQFIPAGQIDTVGYDKSYYMEPDGPAALKPYTLIRQALKRSGRYALARVAIRQRESLALVRPYGKMLVLQTVAWPSEIREPAFAFTAADVPITAQERDLAGLLVEAMSGDYDPSAQQSRYADAVQRLVQAKAAGVAPAPSPGGTMAKVTDMMEMLKASVAAAKAAKDEEKAA